MSECTDTNCLYCGKDNTESKIPEELVDTYGGDYSYKQVYRCSDCGKLFFVYWSCSGNTRIYNWDRYVPEDELAGYFDQIMEVKIKEKNDRIERERIQEEMYQKLKSPN